MVVAASPWQSAHDFPALPAIALHSFAPRSTHSIPGLAKSSACSLRRSSPANSIPDFSGCGRAGSAAVAAKALIRRKNEPARQGAAERWSSLIPPPSSLRDRCLAGHGNRGLFLAANAVVVDPVEYQLAARLGHGVELQVGIRRDARSQLRAEHLGAVVVRHQPVDHVLGYRPSHGVETEAGLHRVLDRDADLYHLAAL